MVLHPGEVSVSFCVVYRVNNAALRRGSVGGAINAPAQSTSGPAGPSGYGGTPAKRGSGTGGPPLQSNNDVDGMFTEQVAFEN